MWLLGPACMTAYLVGLLDHLVHLIRLISGWKVQLPGFLLHFTRFKVRFDHVFVFARAWTRFSSPPSRAELSLQRLATIIA